MNGGELPPETSAPVTNVVPMFLFTLPAGHFADSHDGKRSIVWTTGVMALSKTGECNGGHN